MKWICENWQPKNLRLATKMIYMCIFSLLIAMDKFATSGWIWQMYRSESWPIKIELEDALGYKSEICLFC